MMDRNRYITRQAIKDADSRVLGYEVMYSGGDAYNVTSLNEVSVAETIYNCLVQNTEKALKNSRTFMTFTSSLLAKKTPHLFKNTDLVIQIDDSVIIHPFAMHLLQQYVDEGYEVAANDFQFAPRYLALLEQLSYIKINLRTLNANSAENIMRVAKSMNKRVIATGVDTKELLDFANKLGVYGMQGNYVSDKLANKVHQSGYLRSNFFRLVVAVTKEERDEFKGSKYVQSDLTGVFRRVKQDLKDGLTVLFSGTPCQTAGLHSYIGKKLRANLILVDIVCHGVPSPYIWRDYIAYLEKKQGDKICWVNFRDKQKFGWKAHHETFKFVKGGVK